MAVTFTPTGEYVLADDRDDGWGGGLRDTHRRLDAEVLRDWSRRLRPSITGLTLGHWGGIVRGANGAVSRVPPGTLALPDNVNGASWVYVERTAAGVVSQNTTGFSTGQEPMGRAQTALGQITVWEDWRRLVTLIPQGPWTAPTGTATRTAFDTASVTLPQLAQVVKAVVDDLLAANVLRTS